MKDNNNGRRSLLKKLAASAAGAFGIGFLAKAESGSSEKEVGNITNHQEVPLFSGHTKHGNTVYVAGKGAHYKGSVTEHTKTVLDEIEKELKSAGSSMEKVLKVNVYLADLADYDEMNEAYRGRFGKKPPVRTTVAVYGGVPGNSLVEMDCIAYV
ncbi:RidA family protein [Sphingobacterium corticis]|uniref:RidA family protein n=1 Tax=Sphingobacterium corticis TaxID=1812823 RepID=A0ABW5NLV2_9SPHI